MQRPLQGLPVLRPGGTARGATERITPGSSAGFASIQTSTGRDLGPGALLRERFGHGIQRPRSSSHGRLGLMALCGPELRSLVTQQDPRSMVGMPKHPPLQRKRISRRIQRITMAGAAETMTTIGEAMMEADAEAVVVGSTLMIVGRYVMSHRHCHTLVMQLRGVRHKQYLPSVLSLSTSFIDILHCSHTV